MVVVILSLVVVLVVVVVVVVAVLIMIKEDTKVHESRCFIMRSAWQCHLTCPTKTIYRSNKDVGIIIVAVLLIVIRFVKTIIITMQRANLRMRLPVAASTTSTHVG